MRKMIHGFQIGEISRELGVSVHTIRYYEKLGLFGKPARSAGGFRLYGQDLVNKLQFVKKAKSLGLTLGQIKEIMKCSEEGLIPCCNLVRKIFAKKISEFESKIKDLQRMKRDLEVILSQWVTPDQAKKRSYIVCPQIERESNRKERR